MLDLPWWPATVNAGEVAYPPGGTHGPRTQQDYQLVAMHRGHVQVNVDGALHRFEAGTVFLLRPGHREFFQFAERAVTVHTWVAARVPAMPEAMLRGIGPAPPALPLSPGLEGLIRLAAALPHGLAAQRPPGPEPAHSLARAALAYFWHEAGLGEAGGRSRPVHPAVERAAACVRQRLAEPLTLADLAGAAAVSAEHLCRLFRASGLTPMGYLWGERVREGLRLLAGTGLSIQEIAARCGFRTTFHFAHRVRAATGLSPTAYRAAHWNPEPEAARRPADPGA